MHRMYDARFLIVGIILFMLNGSGVNAQQLTLSADKNDNPLKIVGVLNAQTHSFAGNIRLTVQGGDSRDVLLLPSDLRDAKSDLVISRSNITIPSGISLSRDQPRDVRVTINDITRPGEYAGQLKFLVPGQTEDKALTVEIKLVVFPQPDVKPINSSVTFQTVRCTNWISCTIADLLLPGVMSGYQRNIQFDNQTPADVDVTSSELILHGDKTGAVVTSNEIHPSAPEKLTAGKVVSIELTIDRNRLLPDHYQGTYRLKLRGLEQPVPVNFTLDVRNGLLIPLLVILVGILVGRIAQSMASPEAQSQSKLLSRFYSVRSLAEEIHNPLATNYLSRQLADIRRRIELSSEAESALASELTRVETYARFLLNLEIVERQLTALGLDTLSAELVPKLKEARLALMKDDAARAEELRKLIEEKLRAAESDTAMGTAADLIGHALREFQTFGDKLIELSRTPASEPGGGARTRWKSLVPFLAGSPQITAETRFWVLRPLLFLILLVILVLAGLQTLYINAGATFGAGGVYDYLGLFLWGLSADVAQRTLQSVQVGK